MYKKRTVTVPRDALMVSDWPTKFPGLLSLDTLDWLINKDPVVWEQAHGQALTDGSTWYSGRARAVLPFAGSVIVATSTGGLWIVAPDGTTTAIDLPSPDLTCLVQAGNGPIYAGARGSSAIYQNNNPLDLTDWSPVAFDANIIGDHIDSILVVPKAQSGMDVIFLATTNGVFWSTIAGNWRAGSPPQPDSYTWHPALLDNSAEGTSFWSLARGASIRTFFWATPPPGGFPTIIVGAKTNAGGGVLFLGILASGTLSLWPAQISLSANRTGGTQPIALVDRTALPYFGTTSVASCAKNPKIAYAAVASNGNNQALDPRYPTQAGAGRISQLLCSTDGGFTWRNLPQKLTNSPGLNSFSADGSAHSCDAVGGGANAEPCNCIAVSPVDPNLVLLGTKGLFVSYDGGQLWTQMSPPHVDFHGLLVTSDEGLYTANDGGVAYLPSLRAFQDLSVNPAALASIPTLPPPFDPSEGFLQALQTEATFVTDFNKNIASLQCYMVDGTRTSASRFDFVTGTQDTGFIYGDSSELHTGGGGDCFGVWVVQEGGQGSGIRNDLRVLTLRFGFSSNGAGWNEGTPLVVQGTTRRFGSADNPVPVTFRAAVYPGTISASHTVGGFVLGHDLGSITDTSNHVFSAGPPYQSWSEVWSIPKTDPAEALTALSISSIFPVAALATGTVSRIVVWAFGRTVSFGSVNGIVISLAGDSTGRLFALTTAGLIFVYGSSGGTWSQTTAPQVNYRGLVADDRGHIYAFDDMRVIRSGDGGATWRLAWQNLPLVGHLRDLRFIRRADGSGHLYLATYGRGVWRASIP